jgi:6-pyruvoyltetrahydropterin/6-carboxytetrahydropterin synthase
MYLVKVCVTFSAAHRLCREDLTEEENFALYGKCSNPNGHGHNYDLEVVVAGEIDPKTGMVINFFDVQRAVEEHVHDKVDHRNLNCDVDFMRGVIPTAENMATRFWEILEPHITNGRLHSITVGERNGNVVTYFGPSPAFGQAALL